MQTVQWETEIKSKNLGRKVDRDEETGRAPGPLPDMIRSVPLPPMDTNEALQGGMKHG